MPEVIIQNPTSVHECHINHLKVFEILKQLTEETKLTLAVKLRRLLNELTIKNILMGDKAA